MPTMLSRKSSLDNLTASDFAVRKKTETLVGARRRKSSMPTRIRQSSFHSWPSVEACSWRICPWILLYKVWHKHGPKRPPCPDYCKFNCLVFDFLFMKLYRYIKALSRVPFRFQSMCKHLSISWVQVVGCSWNSLDSADINRIKTGYSLSAYWGLRIL